MPVGCYTQSPPLISHVSAIVETPLELLLAGSVNRDLFEHLPFGILEGGVEDFIEQNLSFIRSCRAHGRGGGLGFRFGGWC